jgi:hypothetical protein
MIRFWFQQFSYVFLIAIHAFVLSGCEATEIRANFVDRTGPNQSTQLTWVESSPLQNLTATASWSPSSSTDLGNQKIQFYQGSSCDTESGSLIDLNSKTTSSQSFTAPVKGNYTYKIVSIDAKGNSSESDCSNSILLGTTPMVSTWQTSNPGETITLPLPSGFTYNAKVDWGDGSTSMVTSDTDPDRTHVYANPGIQTITISGILEAFSFNNAGDRLKLKTVSELGDMNWKSFAGAFYGCDNLTIVATTDGDFLANVTNMSYMFAYIHNAQPDTSNWNTSSVTNMSNMFWFNSTVNPNVTNWNTSNVTDMSWMFANTTAANPNTTNWNTSSVTSMSCMFRNSYANPNTTNWNTSNVTNMASMFSRSNANPNTTNWNTSNVTNMTLMFYWNTVANPDTSNWDTSNVTSMSSMFYYASNANPVMSNWNFANVTSFSNMLSSSGLSTANYDILLNRIVATSTKTSLDLGVGNKNYSSAGQASRTLLSTSIASGGRGWNISDGGLAP